MKFFQLDSCPKHKCISTVGVRYDLFHRDADRVRVTDFFGSVRNVQLLDEEIEFPPLPDATKIEKYVNNQLIKLLLLWQIYI